MTLPLIQGTPLMVDLVFVDPTGNPPALAHPLSGPLEDALVTSLSPKEKAQVTALLTTPFDQLFEQAWLGLIPMAQQQIAQAIASAQPGVNQADVNVNPPLTGTLRAGTAPLPPGTAGLPPGVGGTLLALEFFLPGFTTTFRRSTLPGLPDAVIELNFDGQIEIDVIVPADSSVPLSVFPNGQASFDASNFQLSAGNLWTGIVLSIAALVSVLEGKGFPNFDPPNSKELVPIADLGLIGPLSDAFKGAAHFGFTQLGAQINANPPAPAPPGNTIEIDIIHPADPGPQLQNALTPPGPVFLPPQIGLATPDVPAGSQVGVNGSWFPAAQATQLKISWVDTTSGDVFSSEVLWGPTPSPGVPPQQPATVSIDRTIADSTFTVTGLTPGTEYGFLVRDFDADGFVATGWSIPASPQPPDPQPWAGIWTFITTQATEQVDLVLSYQNTDLGTATLQTDGTFATTVTVPASVPAGSYLVTAMLAGQPMAQALITVLPQGQAPPAILQVIDPSSNLPVQGTATVVGGLTVNLKGQNFGPGTVNLWIDAIGGTSLGSATVDPTGMFTAAFFWPNIIGAHQILAEEGSQQATAPVWAEGAPSKESPAIGLARLRPRQYCLMVLARLWLCSRWVL